MKKIYIASIIDFINNPLIKTFNLLYANDMVLTKMDSKFKTILRHYVIEHLNDIQVNNFNIKVVIVLDCNPINNWRNTAKDSYYSNLNIIHPQLNYKIDSVVLERIFVDIIKAIVKDKNDTNLKLIKFTNLSSMDVIGYIKTKLSSEFILFESNDIKFIENNNIFVHDNLAIPEYIITKLESKLIKENLI